MAGGWRAALARRIEFPEDVTMQLPLVHLTGNIRARVENHRGIDEYTPELIRIETAQGLVVIRGRELLIREMARDDLICVGTILAVELYERPG